MKYIRSTEQLLQRNMMAVQVDEQVFYKTVRDIRPGEEMLLYARDALYPEMELESMHKVDEDNQAYPCGDCGEVFRSKVALRRHQTYACAKSQSYVRSMTLDTSQDRVDSDGKSLDSENSGMEQEGGQEGEYKCDQCPKSFQWKSNLVRHQVTHDEDRRYPCENCDKVFTDPSNLQRHIRSQHVGARCHACSECGKTFATSSGLKQHQHIHSSVKPFQCEVCLKAYTQFSNLCRHKRMHADCRQQIKCKDCGQAFSTVTSLSKHKRFCEGALRSGMRLCYPQDKLNPMALSPGSQPSPHFNPGYMNLYSPRPPYFFPPLSSAFPVLQPALPPGMLGTSPLSPTSLSLGHAGFVLDKLAASESRGSPTGDKESMKGEHLRQLSDGYQTDGSLGSDPDIGSVSDEENEVSPCKIQKVTEPGEIVSSPFSAKHLLETAASRLSHKISHLPPPVVSPPKPAAESSGSSDMPFDLSKSARKHETRSPSSPKEESLTSPPPSRRSSSRDDAPLDLSKKAVPEVLPVETPRKTHIYGGELRSPVIPEPKYPAFPTSVPYPFPAPASLMESMLRLDKEKITQSFQQEMVKFMAFPRYPIPGMPTAFGAAINHLGMLRPEMDKSLPSPILKMDKVPDGGSHHSPHHPFPYGPQSVPAGASVSSKMKERYACKFCGKIFPRSANLTRHLRTHTGEQPYKCKYCERSFSISSNLQRHVRNIHNKEKPFRCPLCDRSFGQQTNLDRHLKKHEQEGPHVADSPTAELENKDEAYFSEIRNFLKTSEEAVVPASSAIVAKPEKERSSSPAKNDVSDAEDEKDSDLTVVDDDVDDEEAFSDDADVDCGEELNLSKSAWRDVKPSAAALNNNGGSGGDLEKSASFVMDGVKDEPSSPVADKVPGFEVKAGPAAAAVACSS